MTVLAWLAVSRCEASTHPWTGWRPPQRRAKRPAVGQCLLSHAPAAELKKLPLAWRTACLQLRHVESRLVRDMARYRLRSWLTAWRQYRQYQAVKREKWLHLAAAGEVLDVAVASILPPRHRPGALARDALPLWGA